MGTIFSIIFHLGTKEPKGGRRYTEEEDDGGHSYGSTQAIKEPQVMMKWSDWLKESQFYQVSSGTGKGEGEKREREREREKGKHHKFEGVILTGAPRL